MNKLSPFKKNSALTLGVELELQLVNLHNFDLTMESEDFLRRLTEIPHPGELKPEITKSMIELNSSIHFSFPSLIDELYILKNVLSNEAKKTHIGICGGGTHPFQKWKQQRIFPTERFAHVSELYGYLAKQFTVFGQHIHIACPDGDDALYLCHAMAHYLPHFIALSAASPFQQSVDTSFDCSRLAAVSAFPLSGTPPWVLTWEKFEEYFEKMIRLQIIDSMKDFYWDIRPKPEFGTVELRICDTPLTVKKAAELAAYAQALCYWLLETRPVLSRDIYLTYMINKFRAARYGLNAIIVEPGKPQMPLAENILKTCETLKPYAEKLESASALLSIEAATLANTNGAHWLREQYNQSKSFSDVVRQQVELWTK
ncbi:MAG: glutamate--cysteine ligase [Proteobacteria bacterium]|nr:glutamate--cysteine ligase [Pseudomonadota bacterium]